MTAGSELRSDFDVQVARFGGSPLRSSDLAFRWGAKQGDHAARNPSSGTYSRFRRSTCRRRGTYTRIGPGQRLRGKASQICAAAAALTNGAATVREIERALFMIGYDVRGSSPLPTLLPTAE